LIWVRFLQRFYAPGLKKGSTTIPAQRNSLAALQPSESPGGPMHQYRLRAFQYDGLSSFARNGNDHQLKKSPAGGLGRSGMTPSSGQALARQGET